MLQALFILKFPSFCKQTHSCLKALNGRSGKVCIFFFFFSPHSFQKFVIQRTAELEVLTVFNGTLFIFLFLLTLFKLLP